MAQSSASPVNIVAELFNRLRCKILRRAKRRITRRRRIDGAAQEDPIAKIERGRYRSGDSQSYTKISDSDGAVQFTAIDDDKCAADGQRGHRKQPGVFRTQGLAAENSEERPLPDAFCVKADARGGEYKRGK
jgi:hypothetical protein